MFNLPELREKKSNMNTMFHNATFILTYIQLRVQLVNTTLGCLVIIPTMSFKDTHNMVKSVPGILESLMWSYRK